MDGGREGGREGGRDGRMDGWIARWAEIGVNLNFCTPLASCFRTYCIQFDNSFIPLF